jgi:hypothetical protein
MACATKTAASYGFVVPRRYPLMRRSALPFPPSYLHSASMFRSQSCSQTPRRAGSSPEHPFLLQTVTFAKPRATRFSRQTCEYTRLAPVPDNRAATARAGKRRRMGPSAHTPSFPFSQTARPRHTQRRKRSHRGQPISFCFACFLTQPLTKHEHRTRLLRKF